MAGVLVSADHYKGDTTVIQEMLITKILKQSRTDGSRLFQMVEWGGHNCLNFCLILRLLRRPSKMNKQ